MSATRGRTFLKQFLAFLWLRWRLLVNMLRKAGILNAIILALLAIFLVFGAAGMFAGFLSLGLFGLTEVPPPVLMYLWDGLIVGLLICWSIGLLSDLQQSEVLSLDKFLHLPVSISGTFFINYLSSLLSVTLILFVPAFAGLSLGLVVSRGPSMILLFPLVIAFLFMVTAVTHQLRSWLASLMVNKRRRRTVIVVITMLFLVVFQLPNLINILRPWDTPKEDRVQLLERERNQKLTEIHRAYMQKQVVLADQQKQIQEISSKYDVLIKEARQQAEQQKQQTLASLQHIVSLINTVLPLGWLALGAMDAAAGEFLVPLAATLGMALIGSASLWRSYRTTLRLYTGQFTTGSKRAKSGAVPATTKAPAPAVKAGPPTLLEKKLPWISEQASAIATASFRSLLRAPEVKMMFLTPIIMVVIFGGLFTRGNMNIPEAVRSLIAFGVMSMILLTMIQLIGNQFGFDRSGFRVFVLCAAPRRDILLGKNLAFAPLALGLAGLLIVVLQFLKPLRWDHFIATLPQMVSMYLLFCLLGNCMSILAPIAISAGSMRMTQMKGLPMVLHMLFGFLFPVVVAPTMLPLGIELLLVHWLGWAPELPINLVLSLLECAVIVLLYHLLLPLEGQWLQSREQKILQVVAAKAE